MFLVFQEKIDALKVLGADVRPVPAVPFDNPDNYNHQVCVCVCVCVCFRIMCVSVSVSHNKYVCVTYTVMFVIFRMCVCWWLCVKFQQHIESRYAYST